MYKQKYFRSALIAICFHKMSAISLKPLQESVIGFKYVHNKQTEQAEGKSISCLIKICIGPGWREW